MQQEKDKEKIAAVQRMQDYINNHAESEDFDFGEVYETAAYSRRHADRIFKELTGKTPQEYVTAVRLSKGAAKLAATTDSVLEIALDSSFQSHEGFSRAFKHLFRASPREYRRGERAIPLFIQYPVSHYHVLLSCKEEMKMDKNVSLCMVTPKDRPKRKLLYLPSKKAEEYLSYCEEMGCEWEGLLNSISERFDTAALIELPDFLVKPGFSKIAAGIEVLMDCQCSLPEGYETAELEPCTMLYFQSEPYEDEQDFCQAIESTYGAIEKYESQRYGYDFAYDLAPSFNFGAEAATGAKIAVPAKKL